MAAALISLAALLILPVVYLREVARERRRRADYFGDALNSFDTYRVTQEGAAWPILEARYHGHAMRLEPVIDDLAWRKVPSLWLKATLLSASADRGMLGLLVRARGGEFYSPTAEMRHRLSMPDDFPADAVLYTDCLETAPIAAARSQIDVFDDPRMKEMVITAKGVRLVYQAAQAERSSYLVLRQARFQEDKIDAELVRVLLDRLITLKDAADRNFIPQAEAA